MELLAPHSLDCRPRLAGSLLPHFRQQLRKRVFFSWGQFVSALIMMGIGVLYLGRNMGLIDAAIVNRFWQILLPVLLIFLGFSLLRKRGSGRGGSNRLAFMGGGVDIGQKSWKLENGNYLPSWAGSSWI